MESIATHIFRSRKTIIEMLGDRKYDLSGLDNIDTDRESFNNYNKENKLDIHVINSEREVYVKFIKITKVKPATLRELISEINNDILTNKENKKILIVLLTKPNNTVLKIKNEKHCENIELFWIGNLLINITKHSFVPTHEKVETSDYDDIKTKFSLSNFNQLPIILKSDPVSKYYGFESGDICKITRKNKISGISVIYRLVK